MPPKKSASRQASVSRGDSVARKSAKQSPEATEEPPAVPKATTESAKRGRSASPKRSPPSTPLKKAAPEAPSSPEAKAKDTSVSVSTAKPPRGKKAPAAAVTSQEGAKRSRSGGKKVEAKDLENGSSKDVDAPALGLQPSTDSLPQEATAAKLPPTKYPFAKPRNALAIYRSENPGTQLLTPDPYTQLTFSAMQALGLRSMKEKVEYFSKVVAYEQEQAKTLAESGADAAIVAHTQTQLDAGLGNLLKTLREYSANAGSEHCDVAIVKHGMSLCAVDFAKFDEVGTNETSFDEMVRALVDAEDARKKRSAKPKKAKPTTATPKAASAEEGEAEVVCVGESKKAKAEPALSRLGRQRTLSMADKAQVLTLRSLLDSVALDLAKSTAPSAAFATIEAKLTSLDSSSLRQALTDAIAAARKESEEDKYDQIDDLHYNNVGHLLMNALNDIEGYQPIPKPPLTEKQVAAHAAAREKRQSMSEAMRQKLKEKDEKEQKKLREKEEAQKEKEAQKQEQLRIKRLEKIRGSLPDASVPKPSTLGTVQYKPNAFGIADAYFEDVLEAWTMLVSCPLPLKLSKFSLTHFLSIFDDKPDTMLVEEMFRSLLSITSGGGTSFKLRENYMTQVLDELMIQTGLVARKKEAKSPAAADADASSSSSEEETDTDEEEEEEEEEVLCGKCNKDIGMRKYAECKTCDEQFHLTCCTPVFRKAPKDGTWRCPACQEERGDKESSEEAEEEKAEAEAESAEGKQSEEPAAGTSVEDTSLDGQAKKVIKSMQDMGRTYCSWINLDVAERVVVVKFFVKKMLHHKAVQQAMAQLVVEYEDDLALTQRKVKDAQDGAARRIKQLVVDARAGKKKAGGSASPVLATAGAEGDKNGEEDGEATAKANARNSGEATSPQAKDAPLTADQVEEKKKAIEAKLEQTVHGIWMAWRNKWDRQDLGHRIRPLGEDRYNRLYWRFPMDKRILVQTVAGYTKPFPVTTLTDASGKPAVLIDDDEETTAPPAKQAKTSKATTADAEQTTDDAAPSLPAWGVIAAADVDAFVATLERRGQNEEALYKEMTPLAPFLAQLANAPEASVRMTRSRALNHGGYINMLS